MVYRIMTGVEILMLGAILVGVWRVWVGLTKGKSS